jgi:hypothetical protein
MSELSKELFLLDIEAAIRELMALDGLVSDQKSSVSRLLEELAGLLFSLPDDDFGACGVELLRKVSDGSEPARVRRMIREYCELVSSRVASFRTGEDHQVLVARLATLRSRIGELGATSLDFDQELSPVSSGSNSSLGSESSFPFAESREASRTLSHASTAPDPVVERVFTALRDATDIASSIMASSGQENPDLVEPNIGADIFGSLALSPISQHVPDTSMPTIAQGVRATIFDGTTEGMLAERQVGISPVTRGFVPLPELGRRIDKVFVQAVANIQRTNWTPGSRELLEAIDGADQQSIRVFVPDHINFKNGASVQIDCELGNHLSRELTDSRIDGIARAVITANTLLLTISYENISSINKFAKTLAMLGGRLELDSRVRSLLLVVPSSRRLLRFVPLEVGAEPVAISWSQYIPQKDADLGEVGSVKLLIGDEFDSLNAVAIGKDEVGIFYPMPSAIRKQDRFRGLVLTASSSYLPVYG